MYAGSQGEGVDNAKPRAFKIVSFTGTAALFTKKNLDERRKVGLRFIHTALHSKVLRAVMDTDVQLSLSVSSNIKRTSFKFVLY